MFELFSCIVAFLVLQYIHKHEQVFVYCCGTIFLCPFTKIRIIMLYKRKKEGDYAGKEYEIWAVSEIQTGF